MTTEHIIGWFDQLERESKALKEEALRNTWWMRGGLNYTDAIMLSRDERKIINEIVKGHMETTKESKMPFF